MKNRTIVKSMLGSDSGRFEPYNYYDMLDQPILDELNRTIVKSMLGSDSGRFEPYDHYDDAGSTDPG